MGKFINFSRIKLKLVSGYIKNVDTSWKFQLEIISNKKVIAKKPLTNLYEMNSTCFFSDPACEVHFDNTPVPVENVLGEVGGGFKVSC